MATPPFTKETATQKVQAAQRLWNTRDPSKVVKSYTDDSIWRNRDVFVQGHDQIQDFLKGKWDRELRYKLKKALFTHNSDQIAVNFWYEYCRPGVPDSRSESDAVQWYRCYGLEHWTFADDGRMRKRQMSGNDVPIREDQRWFSDDMDDEQIDALQVGEHHF